MLMRILNIICKRDSDIYQEGYRGKDHDQIMADAIDKVLDEMYDMGKQDGINQERARKRKR